MTTLELKKIIAFCGGKFFLTNTAMKYVLELFCFVMYDIKAIGKKQLIYVIRN